MRFSIGLVNRLNDRLSLKDALAGYILDIYTGTQPTLPENSSTGTLLCSVTLNSGAYTPETAASGTVTLAGAAGSVNTVTVNSLDILGGAVAFNTDLTTTAATVATKINRNPRNKLYFATSSGAVVTIRAVNGLGTAPNGWVVSGTLTTMTATYANMAGGVNSVNGLTWDVSTGTTGNGGTINKNPDETWSGINAASGTAGWFRIRGAGDTGTSSDTSAFRVDGNIGTSGADMNLGSLALVSAAPFIISSAYLSLPQQ